MTKVVMLTGDCDSAAKGVAHELDLNDYRASVLPENKATYILMLKDQGHTVIMVGDGINDTPARSKADVSISMQDNHLNPIHEPLLLRHYHNPLST